VHAATPRHTCLASAELAEPAEGKEHEGQYVLFTKWSLGALTILVRSRVHGLIAAAPADDAAAVAPSVSFHSYRRAPLALAAPWRTFSCSGHWPPRRWLRRDTQRRSGWAGLQARMRCASIFAKTEGLRRHGWQEV
jgi:hypothetical protein